MKVVFPVQHGFAIQQKRDVELDLPITAGVRSKIQELIHTKLRV